MEFKLRPWEFGDADNLAEYANNKEIAKNMTDGFPHPYSLDNALDFIDFANSHEPASIFAIEINQKAAGGIGLHPQLGISRKNAELGYWLAQPFWGMGITTQAVRKMIDYGFNNLEINRIFARPFGNNIASQRVLEKSGFILEAHFKNTFIKNGEFEDELIYAVRRVKTLE